MQATTSPDADEQEDEEEDKIEELPLKKSALESNGTATTNGVAPKYL